MHRFENEILFEEMAGSLQNTESALSTMAAVVFEKDSDYWLYHRSQIEDDEEEKLRPADKAWLIVKYASPPHSHHKGYNIKIGDTIKFGRVRFKVIMMHTEAEGEQIFKESKFKNKKPLKKKRRARRAVGSRSSLGNTDSDDVDGHEGEQEEEDDDDEEDDEDEEEEDDFGEPEDDLEATLRRNNAPIIQANRHDEF